jgi:transcriptional regulator with XRE-family HTH domain
MISIESGDALLQLGQRLRALRVRRNETQAVFAARIGVAVPTLRDMEQGKPTVQIGAWVNAIWALGRLPDLETVLAAHANIFERLAEQQQPQRKRPFVKRRPRKVEP